VFRHFKRFINQEVDEGETLDVIGWEPILLYKGSLSDRTEHYLGGLKGFLKKWYELGYPGITNDAYNLLNLLTLKGNVTGEAVLTMDPVTGPFTELELQAIHKAVNVAYATGKISNRQYSLVWLFIGLGPRNVQIADLKVKDLTDSENGSDKFTINMPRAKQRYKPKRAEFKPRPLLKKVGEVVAAWAEQVKLIGADRAPGIDPGELPLFPAWDLENAPGFEHHSTGWALGSELQAVFNSLTAMSHRTRAPLLITARRFRYTLGTRAAAEGYSKEEIAEMLDHSTTNHVWVYVYARPEMFASAGEALAPDFAWIITAFTGKISGEGGTADTASVIRQPGSEAAGVGRCGGCGDCMAMVPHVCYVCPTFTAFIDGPHQEVLDSLIAERERILAETADERIAHANDNIILAVQEVIVLCNEIAGIVQ
jgi:integrase